MRKPLKQPSFLLSKKDCWYVRLTLFSRCINYETYEFVISEIDNLAGRNILWSNSSSCVKGCKASRERRETHCGKALSLAHRNYHKLCS